MEISQKVLFETAHKFDINFVVDRNGLVVDIIAWRENRWIPGSGVLAQVLLEEEVFNSFNGVKAAVASLYKTLPPEDVSVEQSKLDSCINKVPCEDKVININGKAEKHEKENYNTSVFKVSPNSKVPTPAWNKFISDTCSRDGKKDGEYENYLAQILGYSLFGFNDRKEFYFLYGPKGNNGKSTLVGIMNHIMGCDYFYTANKDLMRVSPQGSDRFCLAPLRDKRFVCVGELEPGAKLNVNLLKSITGCDEINAQEKYKSEFTFYPTCKIFCMTNHLPEVSSKGAMNAIRQRMRILPFENCVPDRLIDKGLVQKLKTEAPGIMAKLLTAAIKGYKEGIKVPNRIQNVEEQEFFAKDPIADFLSCFKENQNSYMRSLDVKNLFDRWLAENFGEASPFKNTRSFTAALRERNPNLRSVKKGSVSCLIGVDFTREIEETKPPTPKPEVRKRYSTSSLIPKWEQPEPRVEEKAPESPPEAPEKSISTEAALISRQPGESVEGARKRLSKEPTYAERVLKTVFATDDSVTFDQEGNRILHDPRKLGPKAKKGKVF